MRGPLRSSVPLHHQIAQVLRVRLESGDWSSNGVPATERRLCEEFGVSRTTVRLALSQLKQAGLLEARRGVGTRGTGMPAQRRVVGAGGDPLHASLGTSSRVAFVGVVPAPTAVAAFFEVTVGAPLSRIVRIHSLAGRPLSVVDAYLPVQIGSAFSRAELKQSMHELLWQRFRLRQARSVHSIRVARADVEIAGYLGVALADPVLRIQASVYLDDGKPIRWIDNSFREDQYEYVAELEWLDPAGSSAAGAGAP